MKRFLLILALAATCLARVREPGEARNTLFIELGGNAGLYSINYDRIVTAFTERHRIGFRVGFSLLPLDTVGIRYPLLFPLTVNYLLGKTDHKFEVGMGVSPRLLVPSQDEADEGVRGYVAFAATLGYRLQRYEDDFNFRFAFTPLFSGGFTPWFGLSLGRSF